MQPTLMREVFLQQGPRLIEVALGHRYATEVVHGHPDLGLVANTSERRNAVRQEFSRLPYLSQREMCGPESVHGACDAECVADLSIELFARTASIDGVTVVAARAVYLGQLEQHKCQR